MGLGKRRGLGHPMVPRRQGAAPVRGPRDIQCHHGGEGHWRVDREPDRDGHCDFRPAPAAVNLTVTPPTRFVDSSTGISVNFTASVTGGTPPYTYHWDFGDGGQSDATNPTHTYATTGAYRVSVTVTDAEGQSVARTFEFVVPLHSIPPSGGGTGLTPFVLAAAIAVAAAFAVLWWNERRKGRIPPDPPQP